jgi:hypothetical protein
MKDRGHREVEAILVRQIADGWRERRFLRHVTDVGPYIIWVSNIPDSCLPPETVGDDNVAATLTTIE